MKNLYFENRITEWLNKKDPVVKLFVDIGEKFGTNELIMVALKSRKGETFSNEVLKSLKLFTNEMKEREEISSVKSIVNMPDIRKIEEGIEVKDFLGYIPEKERKLNEIKKYALSKESYVNNVISEDGEWLAIAIYLRSGEDPVKVFGGIVKPVVEKYFSLNMEIYYSGEPSTAYFADEFIKKDLRKLVPIIILTILIILYFSFRNFKGVVLPTLVVLIATIWVFGLMGLIRKPMNLITPALPVLLIALGSAYGIHVLNRIMYEEYTSGLNFSTLKKVVMEVFIPVSMTGVTTIIGFCSFITAKIATITTFGLFAAAGILFSTLISLFFIPASYKLNSFKKKNSNAKRDDRYFKFLLPLSRFVKNHPKFIIFISVIIFIIFIIWIPRISRKVNFIEYFPKNSVPSISFEIIKNNFGGASPLTVYFKSNNLKSASFLRLMRRVENYIFSLQEINNPFSVVDFIQEINYQLNNRYHIPDSDGGVSNLWFFIEGRDELRQILTEDYTEGLILSKLPQIDVKFLKKVREKLKDFLGKEFSRDYFEYRLDNLSEKEIIKLKKEETGYVLEEISWLLSYYNRNNENRFDERKAQEILYCLIDNIPTCHDSDVKEKIEEEFKDYIFSDYFDFEISINVKNKLYKNLCKEIFRGKFSKESLKKILESLIPSFEYDEEIANDVIETLFFRIEEAKRISFTERAYKAIKGIFPQNVRKNDYFNKKVKGLFYEIADNLVILPIKILDNTYSKKINIEKIEQSGFPSFMTKIDQLLYISQLQSLILALFVTFIVMIIMRHSFLFGMISLIPILFTLGIIYGFLGFSGIPLDYATMMIAGISIGVGIDYAIHLIHSIGNKMDEGYILEEAIQLTFLEKGKAILVNSIAVMAGFAVLLFSSLAPLRHLGGVMVGSMFLAAFSALTILPSVIFLIKSKAGGEK
jgi:hypothetical protein